MSALTEGWADARIASIYHQLEMLRDEFPSGNTETGCLSIALQQIELADVHVEKRLKEEAA